LRFSVGIGRILILGGVLGIGIITGSITVNTIIAQTDQSKSSKSVPVYPKNENGETYGTSLYARTPEEEPDLIEAYGEGGIKGYVRKEDLRGGEMPKTPEEAIAIQNKRKAEGPRTIPLYDVDGKTVIGVFKFGEAQVVYK